METPRPRDGGEREHRLTAEELRAVRSLFPAQRDQPFADDEEERVIALWRIARRAGIILNVADILSAVWRTRR